MNLVGDGFSAVFRDFNPKSNVNRRETVMSFVLTPFANNGDCTFFIELVGNRTAILFIK